MAGVFNCAADFLDMVAATDYPGTATVLKIDADSGNTTATSSGVPAIGRVLDGSPAGVGENGEIFPKTKKWFFLASAISWTLRQRDQVSSGGGTYEFETVQLIGQNDVYECKSHFVS